MVSDYRFRGISLSDGRPETQLSLEYEHPGGWYAGAFASRVKLYENGSNAQLVAYTGYTRQLPSGLSWDVGATYSVFTQAANYNYAEVYVGATSGNVSGRIHFAPDYFGQGIRSIYAEINGDYPIRERLHLLGHVGLLQPFSARKETAAVGRFDTRIGIGTGFAAWNFQLAWVAGEGSRAGYPIYEHSGSQAVVLSASYAF
jgi:uncharacterized protein (TIGR02001 family)